MNTSNTNTNTTEAAVDHLAQDFKNAVLVLSLFANLAVFTTWVTIALS